MPDPRRALVPLADGVEEMEAVIIIDTLRRAGWTVTVAGLRGGSVEASRGVVLVPDCELSGLMNEVFDAMVLPGGGPGTERLAADRRIIEMLQAHDRAGKIVAAICAAARVLDAADLLENRRYTCHPGVIDAIRGGTRVDERVVVDGNLVTSQGPGTSFEFGLKLIALMDGPDKAAEVAGPMIL